MAKPRTFPMKMNHHERWRSDLLQGLGKRPAGCFQPRLASQAFITHFGANLFHTLIVRDGMLKRMAPWNLAGTSAREPR